MEKRIEIRDGGSVEIIRAKHINLIALKHYEVFFGGINSVYAIGRDDLKPQEEAIADRERKQLIADVENFIFNENHPKDKMVIEIGEFKTLKEKPYVIVSFVVEEGLESPYKISDESINVALSNTTTRFDVKIYYDDENYLDDDEAIAEAKKKLCGYISERAYFDDTDLTRFSGSYDVSYVRVSYE